MYDGVPSTALIEALHQLLGCQGPGTHQLQHDDPVQAHLMRLEHHAHPAPGDLLHQFVIAKVSDLFPGKWSYRQIHAFAARTPSLRAHRPRQKRQPAFKDTSSA